MQGALVPEAAAAVAGLYVVGNDHTGALVARDRPPVKAEADLSIKAMKHGARLVAF